MTTGADALEIKHLFGAALSEIFTSAMPGNSLSERQTQKYLACTNQLCNRGRKTLWEWKRTINFHYHIIAGALELISKECYMDDHCLLYWIYVVVLKQLARVMEPMNHRIVTIQFL